jgi:cytosine deaminase
VAPEPVRLTIANATVPAALLGEPRSGALRKVDIGVAGGIIASIADAGSLPQTGGERIDADGGLLLPCFADIHTHLDKGHIWPRRPNPDGSWMSALLSVQADRETLWKTTDVERRMDFSLRCAYAHGTSAIRTHLDSIPPQHDISWDLFERMRDKWAGRIELQAVSLVSPDLLVNPDVLEEIARRTKASGGVLGGALHSFPRSREAMRAVVEKAGEHGLDIDLHTDECLDPGSQSLLHLAEAVIETGYAGKVLAGHCCALTMADADTQKRIIEKVAEAGVSVVSLPLCNMYLMDRDEGGTATPVTRGVTLVKELDAAGVNVAIASDNTRDPFYAYGDLDMVEVLREGARTIHFDHPQPDAWRWSRMVTAGAAEICGFAHRAVIAEGAPADLVLFRARTWTELNARPQRDRVVLRGGRTIDTAPPDYRELDDLMEA